jgi:hypothetical protein
MHTCSVVTTNMQTKIVPDEQVITRLNCNGRNRGSCDLFTSQGCCLAHLGNIDQTDGSLEEVDGYCSVVEVRASGVFIGVLAGTDRHMLDRFAAGGCRSN